MTLPLEGERAMTKAEAAAAWAEAKEALDEAHAAMTKARDRFEIAAKAEGAAWEALQAIAGRKVEAEQAQEVYAGQARWPRPWQEQTVPIPPKVVG